MRLYRLAAGARRRLAAHACHWEGLPLTSVASAAVDDSDTEAWGDERYMRHLRDDILAHPEFHAQMAVEMLDRLTLEEERSTCAAWILAWEDPAGIELVEWRQQLDAQRVNA